jgi:hypothetical protein
VAKKLRGLISNKRHGKRTYKRWREKFRFEVVTTDQRCANCYFFVPSLGAFPVECGACANPASPSDSQVVAEHHSCEQFKPHQGIPIYNQSALSEDTYKAWHETSERWVWMSPYMQRDINNWKDEWTIHQCGGCRYYVILEGHFMSDWGLCTHPESVQDGKAMFEHDGCEHYTFHVHSWASTTPRAYFLRHMKKEWYNP